MSWRGRTGRLLTLCAAIWLGLWSVPATAEQPTVLRAPVAKTITPVIADHLVDGVREAERSGHQAFLVELDTPGGLDTSMRKVIRSFLGAQVPVIVYVSPSGARAASAGALITFSAHIAAMSPGTTIGAATPVNAETGEKGSEKVISDAAAFAESIAQQRGRNAEFAVDTVRKGRAVAATEAVKIGAVDLIASDRNALLNALEGRQIQLDSGKEVTLHTDDARIVDYELGFFRQLLQILADPTLAFLFLSLGTLAVIYEFANPGVGLGGIIGAILLVLGFFALSVLPVNVAGLALLALAAALFITEVFAPGIGVFAAGGTIALILSGIFLFEDSVRVSPIALWPTAVLIGIAVLVAGRLSWQARRAQPVSGPEMFIGQQVVMQALEGEQGRVFCEGAWWQARPRGGPIQPGDHVQIVALDGLTLIVEPIQPQNQEEAP